MGYRRKPDLDTAVAHALLVARTQVGCSVPSLAQQSGVPAASIRDLENGIVRRKGRLYLARLGEVLPALKAWLASREADAMDIVSLCDAPTLTPETLRESFPTIPDLSSFTGDECTCARDTEIPPAVPKDATTTIIRALRAALDVFEGQ